MNEFKCPQCGAPLPPSATECKYCGEKNIQQPQAQQPMMQQPMLGLQGEGAQVEPRLPQ